MTSPQKVVILGAAGRDFHDFNVLYLDNPAYRVVAFTATQIPDIAGRAYPAVLAGSLYPDGIPIVDEAELTELVTRESVDVAAFAYSDVTHERVMHLASQCIAAGADFVLHSAAHTMVRSTKPVIAICAVRTGVGKSQTSRYVVDILKSMGKKVVSVRHPMPYGDLAKQAVQRFASYQDLDRHECTIEEREEYEPHIDQGFVIYAGGDYEAILREADVKGLRSVAIPAISTGIYGFPLSDACRIAVQALRAGLPASGVELVELVAFDWATEAALRDALADRTQGPLR